MTIFDPLLSRAALAAIGGYRRFVSPHKGFRCAYHAVRGRGSCSDVALRLFERVNPLRALRLLPLQAARCRAAFAMALAAARNPDDRQRKRREPLTERARDPVRDEVACCLAEAGAWSALGICSW